MFALWVFVFGFCGCVNAFFDYSEVEDPFTLFWSNKRLGRQFPMWDALLRENLNACTSHLEDGTHVQGSCKNPAECHLSKGKSLPRGTCTGLFSTCCYFARSCGKSTRSKLSYFTSGSDAVHNRECSYRIHINNENVCQIRLDFEKFSLEQPTTFDDDSTVYKCRTDRFSVSPNPNHIPQICGYNDGQHVYVTVNKGTNLVTLTMALGERTEGDTLLTPQWRIKVRQLECPERSTILDKLSYDQLVVDYRLLAPNYTVQHFIERSGYIRNFGYDEKVVDNKYVSGQKYAISFRRTRDVCGIKFTADYFNVYSETVPATATSIDTFCDDFLFVPAILSSGTTVNSVAKVCGSDSTIQITALPPGPIYVYFYTAPRYEGQETDNAGFKIRYELLTSCNL